MNVSKQSSKGFRVTELVKQTPRDVSASWSWLQGTMRVQQQCNTVQVPVQYWYKAQGTV